MNQSILQITCQMGTFRTLPRISGVRLQRPTAMHVVDDELMLVSAVVCVDARKMRMIRRKLGMLMRNDAAIFGRPGHSRQHACDKANCAANSARRSSACAERRINRSDGVCATE